MDNNIVVFLIQDGLTAGAIYALMGVALVLVFSLTRVIMLFIGEFVGFGALTLTSMQQDREPTIVWLLLLLGLLFSLVSLVRMRRTLTPSKALSAVMAGLGFSAAASALAWFAAPQDLPLCIDLVLTLIVVVPMAGYIYGLVYQPIEDAGILTLLITAVGVHLVLVGLGLYFFGPDGARSEALLGGVVLLGSMRLTGQTMMTFAVALMAMVSLFFFFGHSRIGTALRATAVSRLGSRLVGIPAALSGQIAFLLAAFIATICGFLVGPTTTIYFDTGFVIALKGFVAAVLGGLASYPLTAVAALSVGVLEAFSSFAASHYKDAIVFSLILPALLLRSLLAHAEGDEQ